MLRASCAAVLVAAIAALGLGRAAAATDPNVLCQKTVVKQLEKYKKKHLKVYRVCLDKENHGDIPGPCLDAVSAAKLALTSSKVTAAIATKCTMATLAAVGYRADCQYAPATSGVDGTCAGMSVTTPAEFADCMKCWKGAEFARLEATLYASHAQEVCGTALDDTSATCSDLGCTTPLPLQHDLGATGENDCQRMISKAGMLYLLKVEHQLEKCLLLGGTRASCLADPNVQLKLAAAETQKQNLIHKKCGNRHPVADPPFCCRTGTGNACSVATSRADCTTNLGGTVQEGKVCGVSNTCDPTPGNQPITWWESCPIDQPCPGPTLGDIDGVIDCVDRTANQMVDSLLCLQFPNASACPTATPTPGVPTPTPTSTP